MVNDNAEQAQVADLTRTLRSSRFGCLADDCLEQRASYPEIADHMAVAHPGEFS